MINNVTDFMNEIPENFTGYVIAELTDELVFEEWSAAKERMPELWDKIVEMRVFNKEAEYKIFRGNIGGSLKLRTITKEHENISNGKYSDFVDEYQYLDIDTENSQKLFGVNNDVIATGGGRYHLPTVSMTDAAIIIRYYFGRYETSGQAKVIDWRIVGFKK